MAAGTRLKIVPAFERGDTGQGGLGCAICEGPGYSSGMYHLFWGRGLIHNNR